MTPSGSETTMPTSAVSSETNTPPQSSVSTMESPRPRRAIEQQIGRDRIDEEEAPGADILARRAGQSSHRISTAPAVRSG